MVLAIKARRTEPVRRLVEVVLLDNRETPPLFSALHAAYH
jgi:hypothetical protein